MRDRCEDCSVTRLEEAMSSPAGQLLSRACELDSMLQLPGLSIRLDEISAEVWSVLQLIRGERDRRRAQPAV
jgi:hypothetical protein